MRISDWSSDVCSSDLREYHERVEDIGGGAHFFKPMLAEKYDAFEPGFAQPKLDGVRCIATKDGLFSRQGKPITSCPHISTALTPLFEHTPSLVLDGALYNHDLTDNFNEDRKSPRLNSSH